MFFFYFIETNFYKPFFVFTSPYLYIPVLLHDFFSIVSPSPSCVHTSRADVRPQEHFNYYTMDAALGHLVFSMKYDVIGDQEHLRLMLR